MADDVVVDRPAVDRPVVDEPVGDEPVVDTPAVDEPMDARGGGGLDRIVFFSDAVMAIALTLLAIDLPLPGGDTDRQVWHRIGHLWHGEYLSFAISFVVIAVFWITHHRSFNLIGRFDQPLVWLNILFLFSIVVMPYFTRLLNAPGPGQASTVLYAAVVALAGASMMAMLWHSRRAGLLKPRASGALVTEVLRGLAISVAAFTISIPIAFIDDSWAKWSWLVLGVGGGQISLLVRRLRHRRDTP